MSLEEQLQSKQRELAALTKINDLTGNMKIQLDELSEQVKQIESNSLTVSEVMKIWDSITRSISEAGLGLLRYVEKDYEIGSWSNDAANDNEVPMPEPLVRVPLPDEDTHH